MLVPQDNTSGKAHHDVSVHLTDYFARFYKSLETTTGLINQLRNEQSAWQTALRVDENESGREESSVQQEKSTLEHTVMALSLFALPGYFSYFFLREGVIIHPSPSGLCSDKN